MAEIVPFPISRRAAFIKRQAERAARLNPDAGERHIEQQVKIQIDAMRRKGVADEIIEHEAKCMEAAIRVALWTTVMNRPGGAR